MARRIIFAPEAERDLDGILRFVASDRPIAAENLAEIFERSIRQLGELPYMGPAMHVPLRKGFRKLTVAPYLVVYRVLDDEVQIARIVHSSRDLPSILKYLS